MKSCATNVGNRGTILTRKRIDAPIGSVMFTYTGTDKDFETFLKAVVHDYLMVGDLPLNDAENSIQKVESLTA